MKCAIAVFAKTVGLSPVKTRLAATIGEKMATEFYIRSVACVEAIVRQAVQMQPEVVFPFWAMAEENSDQMTDGDSFPAFWTGEGDLGTRLANVSERLCKHNDAVMMIGTDSPQLSAGVILQAIETLNEPEVDAVCGPAVDGGYYLFAAKKPVERDIWENVTYSASTTLAEFVALLGSSGFSVARLGEMQDVDEAADLASLQTFLEGRSSELLPEQLELLGWLRQQM